MKHLILTCICFLYIAGYASPVRSNMGGRKASLIEGKGQYPYDSEVEYLESTGMQWIDTGICVTGNDEVELIALITQAGAGNSDYRQLFGARQSVASHCADIFYNNSLIYASFNNGSYANRALAAVRLDTKIRFLMSNSERSVFNQVTGTYMSRNTVEQAYDFQTQTHALLFAESGYPAAGKINPAYAKVYSLHIIDTTSGTMRMDLIPVRFTNELRQSEGAMYDRVSGEIFRNRGTGSFGIGPDV